jgi:chaperonin GroEL
MHATKAAVEEGIVPGGGVALLRTAPALDKLSQASDLSHDERVGVAIVRRATEEPMRWIAQNAGEEGNMVVAKVRDLQSEVGFNAANLKYEDLTESGVIDPTKVVRFAIQNASSIAGLMLTTEAVVAEIPEKKKDAPMPPGGGGMEDY